MMKRRINQGVLWIAGVVLFFATGAGPAFGLDVKREELKNGLVLLHSERHNLPIVIVTLLIKASPFDEPAEKAGLANLTAAMLNEGTKKRTSEQISREAEFIAAGVGASADRDYSVVSLSVLKKDVDKGFDLFSDILLNPVFPEDQIAHKKKLIKGGLKQSEEDPGYVAGREFDKALFGPHPYGRQVTGTEETIDRITRDDLAAFHRTYYLPKGSILSVAGDLTRAELDALLDTYLSGWQKGEAPARPKTAPAEVTATKALKVDRELTQATITLGHMGIARSNPDYYAVQVMNYILGGGGFSSRLLTSVRDEMGLAYSIHSAYEPTLEPGSFEVGVQTKNESANTVITEIIRQMEKMRSTPVTADELRDAKSYLTGSFPRRLDTLSKISNFMAAVEFHGLGLDFDRKYAEYVRAVTVEDVQRVAKKYLHPDKYVLVIVADQKKAQIDGRFGK